MRTNLFCSVFQMLYPSRALVCSDITLMFFHSDAISNALQTHSSFINSSASTTSFPQKLIIGAFVLLICTIVTSDQDR